MADDKMYNSISICCFIFVLLARVISASPTFVQLVRASRATNDNPVCNSTACTEMGHFLRASLNSSADPCDDFYEFSCGNWINRHKTIPDSESYIDEWSKLRRDKVVPALMALFEGPNLDPKTMAHSVVLAQALYKDCTDQNKRNQLSWRPFQERLQSLLGFAWPRENGTAALPATIPKMIARFSAIYVQPLLRIRTVVDQFNPRKRIIEFSPPRFGLPRYVFADKENVKHAEQYQAYRNFLKQVFRLIEQASVSTEAQKITDFALDKRIDAVLQLEGNLVLSTLPEAEEEANRIDIWNNRIKYSDFSKNNSDLINYQLLAELYGVQLLNRSLSAEERADLQFMVVANPAYFRNMSALVFNTPAPVVTDFFALKFIHFYRSDGPSDLQQADFELRRVTEGLKAPQPVWEKCLEKIQTVLSVPISRLYVDAHVDPRTKGLVEKMASTIKDEFEYLLKHKADWLDSESIERGKRKLRKSSFKIGYPPYLKNNTELDRVFGFGSSGRKIAFKKGQYFETMLSVTTFDLGTELQELWWRRVNDSEVYALSPMHVNAFALRYSNATFIPIALLQPPFYDPNRPAYLQLAGIGATLGHELVHLFDDQNLKRRPDGQPSSAQWWTDQADRKLKKEADCFIKQYGDLLDRDSGLKVNGQLTLRENIADNSGIRTAFYAFESLEKKEKKEGRKLPKLPHLGQYTPEQTFFIAHAQIFCTRVRPEAARENVLTNPHAPARYRLNVPLSNLKQFSKAFECKRGSKMRPENRCRIW